MLEIRIEIVTDGLNEAIKELAKALGQCPDSERLKALNTVPQDVPVDSHIEVTTEGTKVLVGNKAPEAEQPKAEPAAVAADPVKPEEPKAPKAPKAKPAAAKKEELAPASAQAPVQAAAEEEKATPAAKKTYTFKQISEAGAALCTDPVKIDALIALLRDKYHVNAITSLKEEQYSDLAEDLISLGATIKEG